MPEASPILTAFTAGELSPRLAGRVDLERYSQGCKTLLNNIVHPHGGASRRFGTRYVAEVKDSSKATRLIPFEFSSTQAYILELGDQYIRFFRDNGQILGADVTVDNPGFETAGGGGADVFANWSETAGDGAIALETSLVNEGSGACKLTAGATANTEVTQNITVVAETDYELRFYACGGDATNEGRFAIYDVTNGAYIEAVAATGITSIEYTEVAQEFTTPAGCISIRIEFWCPTTNLKIAYFDSVILKNIDDVYEISDAPWTESQLFQIKYAQDADTMYLVHPDVAPQKLTRTAHDLWTGSEVDFQDGPYLEEVSGVDITPSAMTGSITLTAASPIFKSGHVGALFRWKADDAAWYWLKITAFTSRTVVTATVKGSDLPNTNASNPYRFGAWSPDQGYPNCVAFYEQRLIFAGNPEQPQRIYGSKSQDYENFEVGTNADDAWIYQMASEEVNSIVWLAPARYLNVGTIGGEWIMSSGSDDAPITPTAVKVRRETTHGSYDMHSLVVGLAVLFVQRPGLKVREVTYRYSEDSFAAQDLTILSEHITEALTAATSGIIDWTYQAQPDSIIWCIRADGVMLGFTYEKLQEVFAWHRHKTEGVSGDHSFESVATIPTSSHDQVWVIVNRTINGSTARYIEYIESKFFSQEDAFFLDSGLSYESTKYTVTGATVADPVVITAVGHPYSDGDYIYLEDLGGMTEVNDRTFVVADATADTFALKDRQGNYINGLGHYDTEDLESYYTEYDPDGKIVVSRRAITITDLTNDNKAYVYRDMGVDFFDGDFTHHFEATVTAAVSSAKWSVWAMANTIADIREIDNASGDAYNIQFYEAGGNPVWEFVDMTAGGRSKTASAEITYGVTYYFTVVRDESVGTYGTIYVYIYTDADRTVLFDTLTVTLKISKKNYRYIYAMNSFDTISSTPKGSGTVADLVLGPDYTLYDAYTAYTSGGTVRKKVNSLTGLSHLEGEEVALLSDGAVIKRQTVASGAITTDRYGAVIHAGLHTDSVLETMRVEPGHPGGTSMGKLKRIIRADILFHETLGGKVGTEDGDEDVLVYRSPSDPMGSPPALHSGHKEIDWPGGYDEDAYIRIVQDQPLPMTVLAIAPVVDLSED